MITIDLIALKDGQSLDVHEKVDPKLGQVQFEDQEFTTPIAFDGKVERFKNTLVISGELTAKGETVCGRCLKKMPSVIDESVQNIIQFKDEVEIDIWDGFREQLILNHPLRFVCSPDCKGLCPSCGCDLNVTQCQCTQSAPEESPFSRLQDWFHKKKKEG